MLHHSGGVLLNGSAAPLSSAIFGGAVIETPPNTAASITLTGTRITINPDTAVEYYGDEVVLEHGSVFVETSLSFRVRAGCLLATPAEAEPTQYSVDYRETTVRVFAFRNDVNLDSRSSNARTPQATSKSERVSVREGEQKSREDKCAAGIVKSPVVTPVKDGILNSAWAKWFGIVPVGVLTCIALCRGDDPVSPSGFSH